ncbi:DUF3043 domain-containing protein [Marisediminicola sp. LYQ134]|uniref:DUF3043 domain-containing protein n=1 Tax=Marisediminicola sp. LYQ134 TaxID=3391061 RepID=UPI003982E116
MAKTPAGKSDDVVADELTTDGVTRGKGRATPTRREREAANMRPLVPTDRRAANKEARAKMAAARDKARIGMANGEERYLPARDKGEQRRFVRDYVDARFSVGEALIPLMFLVILTTFLPESAVYSFIALWAFFVFTIIDSFLLGSIVTRKIKKKFGPDSVQRGTRWYAAMRAIQLRPMRLPKPQVKRWKFPT